jgi:archaellum component FlaD/FlaE
MNLHYLPEHRVNARLALELAKREMAHLAYTHSTLFSQTISLEWVKSLSEREDLSEKIVTFVSRFGRLQDHIGEKLIPRFATLLGESPKSLLDVLAYAEKVGWIDSTAKFVEARKLRKLLVHEYMVDAVLFLESLLAANNATPMLIDAVDKIEQQAKTLVI